MEQFFFISDEAKVMIRNGKLVVDATRTKTRKEFPVQQIESMEIEKPFLCFKGYIQIKLKEKQTTALPPEKKCSHYTLLFSRKDYDNWQSTRRFINSIQSEKVYPWKQAVNR
ncbi:hypothetical protein GXN76_11815 [Kroppenstedtia pulmonis]|uniref:Uncharacterized protein n=1 Tax=Kroppenstedtia pulmonis TaxID=1380685 RepID=A0A7D3Y5R2_9BACL|nr:hypothetical protein [Kroppenstedtia pulmonis]QKG85085.1 hypothetical protein GXN76_11815 [Kroppenstedtia pulmonis]